MIEIGAKVKVAEDSMSDRYRHLEGCVGEVARRMNVSGRLLVEFHDVPGRDRARGPLLRMFNSHELEVVDE
jgi:hypothetical protein